MPAPTAVAEQVIRDCRAAAAIQRQHPARRGNVVLLDPTAGDEVFITADLHGQRLNFQRLVRMADLLQHPRRHLVLQEVCHGGPEYPGGGCMSHLLLEDVARLTVEFPGRVHFLLSNHELAELTDYPIFKSRKMLNLMFRCGVQEMYGPAADEVRAAYADFIASCPLAIRVTPSVFLSHSLPEHVDRDGFDVEVLDRPLTPADLRSGGAAFRLVWGRDYRPANADAFAQLVHAELLIQGHEPCKTGCDSPNPRQLILDCCNSHAAYLRLPIGQRVTRESALAGVCHLYQPSTRQPGKAT
jgi:hypothetical protein